MKHLMIAIFSLGLSVTPAMAEDVEDGFNLMEEGAKMLLRGLMTEMEPTLEELRGLAEEMEPAMRELAEEMGPALAELMAKIDDIRNYEAPEILPNGDIIIRRRIEAPAYESGDQIDL